MWYNKRSETKGVDMLARKKFYTNTHEIYFIDYHFKFTKEDSIDYKTRLEYNGDLSGVIDYAKTFIKKFGHKYGKFITCEIKQHGNILATIERKDL